jgi:mRNA interferase RelE/StbE
MATISVRLSDDLNNRLNRLAEDPLAAGRALRGRFKGLYRFRHSDYRVIYALDLPEKKIIVPHVRHRKEAYGR